MWTGKVARTERQGNTLNIIVSYVSGDGVNVFDETLMVTNPQDPSWLQTQIQNRLNQLNTLDEYEKSISPNPILNSTVSINPDTANVILTPVSSEEKSPEGVV